MDNNTTKNKKKKGRPQTEINPERSRRIRELIKDEGINVTKVAAIIGMPQQSLDRSLQSHKVSEQTVNLIAKKFPQYNRSWLLGYSNYKTKWAIFEESQIEWQQILNIFSALAKLEGYTMKRVQSSGNGLSKYFEERHFAFIKEDKEVFRLSDGEIIRIGNVLCENFQSIMKYATQNKFQQLPINNEIFTYSINE